MRRAEFPTLIELLIGIVITQCSIRHLYILSSISQPQKDALIQRAKSMERRRCNHHQLEQPLSTLECLSSVIDPKGSQTNKHRYVVASQEEEVRRYCRAIKGVPLVYVKRSVMVMEPMAESSLGTREGFEKGKFRSGIRGKSANVGQKRNRSESESSEDDNEDTLGRDSSTQEARTDAVLVEKKKKKARGPKGPNPLSVKKPRKVKDIAEATSTPQTVGEGPEMEISEAPSQLEVVTTNIIEAIVGEDKTQEVRRKRKRKHKPSRLAGLLQAEVVDEKSVC